MAINVLAHLAQLALEGDEVAPFNEIHDSVVELVEAANGIRYAKVGEFKAAVSRLDAALARIGGAP
jgi:hypothetical protein